MTFDQPVAAPTEAIRVPPLGTTTIRFSLWYVRAGDWVQAGERLGEVVIPGAVVEIAAPVAGQVRQLLARPGDILAVGQSIGVLAARLD